MRWTEATRAHNRRVDGATHLRDARSSNVLWHTLPSQRALHPCAYAHPNAIFTHGNLNFTISQKPSDFRPNPFVQKSCRPCEKSEEYCVVGFRFGANGSGLKLLPHGAKGHELRANGDELALDHLKLRATNYCDKFV